MLYIFKSLVKSDYFYFLDCFEKGESVAFEVTILMF